MARGRLKFLTQDEMKSIHEVSIRLLETVGIVVNSAPTAEELLRNGASRSTDCRRILIPEGLVEDALSIAPKDVLLAARDKHLDMRIPQDRLYAACGGEGAFVKDLLRGDSRYATAKDVRDFAHLVEKTNEVDYFVMMVGALDQPAHMKHVVELQMCLSSTRKHIQAMPSTTEVARNMVKLSSVVAGSPEELAKRPIFSAIQCPVSPLTFERGLTESQVEFAKAGIPVVAMVATVAGLTSPVTLSGTLAQVNAESLASLVISQTAMKGAPWIYSSDSSAGDLRTGSIDYGAFESQLLRAGAGQMGRFYGLPTMVVALGLEAVVPSLSSAQGGVPYMIIQSLPESDLASGFGGIDQAAGASFEQLLADAWIWGAAKEFRRSFEADDEALSYETLREGCLDGNYLKKRQTLERFRTEFAAVANPDAVLTSKAGAGANGDLIKKAHKESRRILGEPRESLLEPKDEEEIARLFKAWR